MMMAKIMSSMNPQPVAQVSSKAEDMTNIFMIKELTKPGMYEMMMMQRMNNPETGAAPKWLEQMAAEQKETREMMKEILGVKRSTEQMQTMITPIVEQMTKDRETMVQNTQAILGYIQQGDMAGPTSLEGLIANALKTRLVDEAMDAIDRGLFERKEIVTPQGEFSWKGILDRMMNMGEELIKKMPAKGARPGLMPVRATGGFYVHPVTGETLTPEQAQTMIRAAQLQSQPPAPAVISEVQGVTSTPTPPTAEEKAVAEKEKKKKAGEAIDLFMDAGEAKGGTGKQEPQGDEEY